jgi:hypothetical protein
MFLLVGVMLMVAGAARGDMAIVFAATGHFAVGALLPIVDLLTGR